MKILLAVDGSKAAQAATKLAAQMAKAMAAPPTLVLMHADAPLMRRVAAELGLHESTVSRAIARKYVRTPRGTIPLRDFFASGIETEGGGSASSTAIQDMIRKLVEAEDPRKPLSDARLADTLKSGGVPVARRTVAKYREALHIPASHERVRIG